MEARQEKEKNPVEAHQFSTLTGDGGGGEWKWWSWKEKQNMAIEGEDTKHGFIQFLSVPLMERNLLFIKQAPVRSIFTVDVIILFQDTIWRHHGRDGYVMSWINRFLFFPLFINL